MALVWNAAKIGKMLVDIDFNLIQKLSRFSPEFLYCIAFVCWRRMLFMNVVDYLVFHDFAHRN